MTAVQPTIGDYHLVAQIGAGGMGAVYRAVHRTLGNEVAIKVLPAGLAGDESAQQWFRRGAASAAALQHPNILPVWHYGEHAGAPYLVMPCIKGGTLKDRLVAGPLAPAEIVDYLRQLAAALDCAHGQGIVHRDVKPANLLLDGRGHLYLADFGIARALEDATRFTRTGTAVGTPEYMAPEQARGQADRRADLYALGIILYEMLTGRVPFSGSSTVEVLLKHLQEPVPVAPLRSRHPAVPAALEQVLAQALAKDPAARYQTGAALVAAVEAAFAGATTPLAAPLPATIVLRPAPVTTILPVVPTRHTLPPPPPLGMPPTLYSPPPPAPLMTPMPYATIAIPPPTMPPPATLPPPVQPGIARRAGVSPLAVIFSAALVLALLFGGSFFVWSKFFRDAEATTAASNLPAASPSPSPVVVAQASPSASAAASPTAKPSPTSSPSPQASPLVSQAPVGAKPEGWLTYGGGASTPFAIYYPANWRVEDSTASEGSIIFWAPGDTASIRVATIGRAAPGSNIDQLRDQQLTEEINYCIENSCSVASVRETGYDTLNPTFAWFLTTLTYDNGSVYDLRDGVALKGDVKWVYNVVVCDTDTNDAGDVMRAMLPSLNIYGNP